MLLRLADVQEKEQGEQDLHKTGELFYCHRAANSEQLSSSHSQQQHWLAPVK
jgi:hypothetical protein